MPSTPATLLVGQAADGVAVVTFNRPEVLNALDWATMAAFAASVEDLHARAAGAGGDLRAVVVTGAGKAAFSSGGDQRALHAALGADDGLRLATVMGDALARLEQLPVPVVAAVNGHALGGGSEIALACDVRIVAEDVRFGLVHLGLGLVPGWGGGQRLARLVGYGRAMAMLLAAEPYGADALVELGLASEVTPPGEALPAALAFAARVAAADPAAVRAVKALLQAGWSMPYDAALAAERAAFPALWASEAHAAAVARFVRRSGGTAP